MQDPIYLFIIMLMRINLRSMNCIEGKKIYIYRKEQAISQC